MKKYNRFLAEIIEKWVDSFLRQEGKNVDLAEGLKKQKRYWIGPIEISLQRLERCCGPEDSMEFKEPIESWTKRVASLLEHIKRDGHIFPLIVSYKSGVFSICDGNHRYAAYKKLGLDKCLVVIWCDSEKEIEEVLNEK